MRRELLDHSLRVGISFGVTSGIITTLGLLVGLSAGTSSRPAVLGGIFTIAVADSLSDALGIHISEESEGIHAQREVWTATVATFVTKLLTALTFAIPVGLLDLDARGGRLNRVGSERADGAQLGLGTSPGFEAEAARGGAPRRRRTRGGRCSPRWARHLRPFLLAEPADAKGK